MKCYSFVREHFEEGLFAEEKGGSYIVPMRLHGLQGIDLCVTDDVAWDLRFRCAGEVPVIERADVERRADVWLMEEFNTASTDALVLLSHSIITNTKRDVVSIGPQFDSTIEVIVEDKLENHQLGSGFLNAYSALIRMPVGSRALIHRSVKRLPLFGRGPGKERPGRCLSGLIHEPGEVRPLRERELEPLEW